MAKLVRKKIKDSEALNAEDWALNVRELPVEKIDEMYPGYQLFHNTFTSSPQNVVKGSKLKDSGDAAQRNMLYNSDVAVLFALYVEQLPVSSPNTLSSIRKPLIVLAQKTATQVWEQRERMLTQKAAEQIFKKRTTRKRELSEKQLRTDGLLPHRGQNPRTKGPSPRVLAKN